MSDYEWELISWNKKTGESLSLSLNETQMNAIQVFLGIQLIQEKESYRWTSFTNQSLEKLMKDFNQRYKEI